MKKLLSIALSIALMLCVMPLGALSVAAYSDFAGGSGTAEDPYLIATPEQLSNVSNHLNAHFQLINDIKFTDADFAEGGAFYNNGTGWQPIGSNNQKAFSGVFDGRKYTISNLKINSNADYVGLFYKVVDGQVKNVHLDGATIKGKKYVGGICGLTHRQYKDVIISSCSVTNAVITGTEYVGGVIGGVLGWSTTRIADCYASGSVQATTNYAGGICGGMVDLSTNEGHDIIISGCYNNANIYSAGSAGGITAGDYGCDIYDIDILECVNAGDVSAGTCAGGIVAYLYGFVDSLYYSITMGPSGYRYYYYYPTVQNCINKGTIDGGTYAGGIAGYAYSKSGLYYNGRYGGCKNSYNIGKVTGETTSSIIAVPAGSTTTACYDLEDDLTNQATFKGWDFDTVWTMDGDVDYQYPELRIFMLSGEPKIEGSAAYGGTVIPDLLTLSHIPAEYTVTWLIDGEEVATGDKYEIPASSVGKKLTVKITSSDIRCLGSVVSAEYVVEKAEQSASPTIPELIYLDDNTFEITTNPNQEYSIDNVTWQSSGAFDNLDPNQDYTLYSRILENDLYLLGESIPVLNITTDRRPLYGTVSMVGTSRFGDTLKVDVSGVMPENATYTYEWKANGAIISTEATYTITQNDLGKNITVSVKGNGDFIGTLTSPAVTATKTTVQLPNAPVVQEVTNTSVLLVEKNGYEYSKDKNFWQDSPLFEGLAAATKYTFYQRIKETDTTFASKASNGTEVITLKNTIAPPEKPVLESITNNSITVKAIAGYEYSLDGVVWQKSNVFTGLSPNTEYCFCQRIAEDATHYASGQSSFEWAVTLKNSVSAPAAPQVQKATDTSVTLIAVHNYEYSLDGNVWQDSPVFDNLTTLTTYTFYQRAKETSTDYASATSAPLSFKVKHLAQRPSAPTLKEKGNNSIEVYDNTGYEYSIDSINWSANTIFGNLSPNTSYSIYCRIPETDTHYASETSPALMVTTLKNTVSAPTAPVVSTKTDVTVTLVANSAYEYSKDGVNWQKSNIFTGLTPNTSYTFYQRKAATDTAYASGKSAGLTVRTMKSTVAAPAAPTLVDKTATSVTLTSHSGYEYSKDGTNWQKNNVFTGLKPNTTYSFYQRVAETNNANASAASVALKVTTPKQTAATPNAPTAIRVYPTSVVLAPYTGYEYSMDGVQWQSSNTFSGLSANTSYTFYQRVAASNTTYASESSVALRIKTASKSVCSVAPAKPIVTAVTTSSVTLAAREGYEYSKDGTTWQSSSTFTGLSANTSYTFYQRIKESAAELASDKSAGVSVKTEKAASGSTGVSTITNYQLLQNYILRNGYTNSKGRKYIETERYSSGNTYTLKIIDTVDGLWFDMDAESGNVTSSIDFTLSSTSKTFKVTHLLITGIDAATNTIVLDRTTITGDSWYTLSNGGFFQITASNATELFNPQLQLLFTMFEALALNSGFTFGLQGLGFLSYSSYGDDVCDPVSGYHAGSSTTKNAYAATCTINGYTGDTYCSSCGEKAATGSSIPSVGHHTYTNACDSTCNECGEERRVDHAYSDECDASCNVCGFARESIDHVYDNACDGTCNICDQHRQVRDHVYDDERDADCNECGALRDLPGGKTGDVNGDDNINNRDLAMLQQYLNDWDVIVNKTACDLNCDGDVNNRDLAMLQQYLNGWDIKLA